MILESYALGLSRSQLPFTIPAIRRRQANSPPNGRVAHIAISEAGRSPVWLTCWVPDSFGEEQIAAAVGSSHDDETWRLLLSKVQNAPAFPAPNDRKPLSPDAREFAAEMLRQDSTLEGSTAVGLNGTIRNLFAPDPPTVAGPDRSSVWRPNPTVIASPLVPRQTWDDVCNWAWYSYIYSMNGWGIGCTFGGFGWEIQVSVSFFFEDWFDAYLWSIDNAYWYPYTYCATRELNEIAWQYDNENWYNPTAFGSIDGPGSMHYADRATAHWKPDCSEFTQYASSIYFTWAELKEHTSTAWAVIKTPLVVDTSAHYGLDYWRLKSAASRNVNSAYRTPRHNAFVGSTAKGSQHMRGVAVDLENVTQGAAEYDTMRLAAVAAQASWIETPDGHCKYKCTHADWRWWVTWAH